VCHEADQRQADDGPGLHKQRLVMDRLRLVETHDPLAKLFAHLQALAEHDLDHARVSQEGHHTYRSIDLDEVQERELRD